MTVSDNTIEADGIGYPLFEKYEKLLLNQVKKIATYVMKSPGRNSEIGAKIGNAAV